MPRGGALALTNRHYVVSMDFPRASSTGEMEGQASKENPAKAGSFRMMLVPGALIDGSWNTPSGEGLGDRLGR